MQKTNYLKAKESFFLSAQVDTRMVDVYVNLVGKDLRDAHRKYSPVSRLLIKKRG